MQEIVEHYGITYNYMPINKNNKIKQEKELLLLIKKYKIDLVVLARYIQSFITRFMQKTERKDNKYPPFFSSKF